MPGTTGRACNARFLLFGSRNGPSVIRSHRHPVSLAKVSGSCELIKGFDRPSTVAGPCYAAQTFQPGLVIVQAYAIGFNLAPPSRAAMQTETMNVRGMTCGGCISTVTQALLALAGVGHVDVSLPGKASVEFDEKQTSRERLQSAVKDAGYGVAAGNDATSPRTKGACCG